MNFVELVDALRIEGGVSGAPITTLDGSLPLETQRLKKWVRDAWEDIQTRHRWKFLYFESHTTIPQYASVVTPPEFDAGIVAEWVDYSVRVATSGDPFYKSQPLTVVDYEYFRRTPGSNPTQRGRPQQVAIHPRTEALHFEPPADQVYELFFDYWRTPQVLEVDADVPIMPARFHNLIIWHALERYGSYEVAPDVVMRSRMLSDSMWAVLMNDQLPVVTLGTLGD